MSVRDPLSSSSSIVASYVNIYTPSKQVEDLDSHIHEFAHTIQNYSKKETDNINKTLQGHITKLDEDKHKLSTTSKIMRWMGIENMFSKESPKFDYDSKMIYLSKLKEQVFKREMEREMEIESEPEIRQMLSNNDMAPVIELIGIKTNRYREIGEELGKQYGLLKSRYDDLERISRDLREQIAAAREKNPEILVQLFKYINNPHFHDLYSEEAVTKFDRDLEAHRKEKVAELNSPRILHPLRPQPQDSAETVAASWLVFEKPGSPVEYPGADDDATQNHIDQLNSIRPNPKYPEALELFQSLMFLKQSELALKVEVTVQIPRLVESE